jgi:hypothetical protein
MYTFYFIHFSEENYKDGTDAKLSAMADNFPIVDMGKNRSL